VRARAPRFLLLAQGATECFQQAQFGRRRRHLLLSDGFGLRWQENLELPVGMTSD
jgi:hypothetical protein